MTTVTDIVKNLMLCNYECARGSLRNDMNFKELIKIANNGEYAEKIFEEYQRARYLLRQMVKNSPPEFLDNDLGIEILDILKDIK